jgi:hypothetical protein
MKSWGPSETTFLHISETAFLHMLSETAFLRMSAAAFLHMSETAFLHMSETPEGLRLPASRGGASSGGFFPAYSRPLLIQLIKADAFAYVIRTIGPTKLEQSHLEFPTFGRGAGSSVSGVQIECGKHVEPSIAAVHS